MNRMNDGKTWDGERDGRSKRYVLFFGVCDASPDGLNQDGFPDDGLPRFQCNYAIWK